MTYLPSVQLTQNWSNWISDAITPDMSPFKTNLVVNIGEVAGAVLSHLEGPYNLIAAKADIALDKVVQAATYVSPFWGLYFLPLLPALIISKQTSGEWMKVDLSLTDRYVTHITSLTDGDKWWTTRHIVARIAFIFTVVTSAVDFYYHGAMIALKLPIFAAKWAVLGSFTALGGAGLYLYDILYERVFPTSVLRSIVRVSTFGLLFLKSPSQFTLGLKWGVRLWLLLGTIVQNLGAGANWLYNYNGMDFEGIKGHFQQLGHSWHHLRFITVYGLAHPKWGIDQLKRFVPPPQPLKLNIIQKMAYGIFNHKYKIIAASLTAYAWVYPDSYVGKGIFTSTGAMKNIFNTVYGYLNPLVHITSVLSELLTVTAANQKLIVDNQSASTINQQLLAETLEKLYELLPKDKLTPSRTMLEALNPFKAA